MQINRLKEKVQSWFKPKNAPTVTSTLRACFRLSGNEIIFNYLDVRAEVTVLRAESMTYKDTTHLADNLSRLFARVDKDTCIVWQLAPQDYQIFLIDSFPVTEDEFREALSWRIRSLINYPVEEAVVDYFMLPKSGTAEYPIVAAVVSKGTTIKPMLDIIEKAQINLSIIDIPELALRNLTQWYERDERSTAFIYFFKDNALLNITRNKTLYFARHIILGKEGTTAQISEKLSLELLRYFDYYQSQWRYPSPTRVLIASDHDNADVIAASLTEYLGLMVEPYTMNEINLKIADKKTTTIAGRYLPTIGGALREDE